MKRKFCRKVMRCRIHYDNLAEAQAAIDKQYEKNKLRMFTYFCPKCKAIHLSKHAAPKGNFNWR